MPQIDSWSQEIIRFPLDTVPSVPIRFRAMLTI